MRYAKKEIQSGKAAGWKDYEELADDARYTPEYRELYQRRKETIERVFADAKEKHAMRYTQYRGLAQVSNWVKLKFAAMNLKKLAKIKAKWGLLEEGEPHKISILYTIRIIREKWLWDTNPRAALSTV